MWVGVNGGAGIFCHCCTRMALYFVYLFLSLAFLTLLDLTETLSHSA